MNRATSHEGEYEGDWNALPHLVYLGHPRRCLYEYARRTARKKGGEAILIEVEVPVNNYLIEDFEETRGYYTDWKDCLEHFLICAHRGNLAQEQIHAVHFFGRFIFVPTSYNDMCNGSRDGYHVRVGHEDFGSINAEKIIGELEARSFKQQARRAPLMKRADILLNIIF